MENFFSTLKTERTTRQVYATRDADFIERFCNPIRRHSTLGDVSPADFARAEA